MRSTEEFLPTSTEEGGSSRPRRRGGGKAKKKAKKRAKKKQEGRNRLDERLKEKALELFGRLEMLHELPRFDGACVDFHPFKPSVVFIPWIPMIAEVDNGELHEHIARHDVKRVLVDALWPTNVGVLRELIENGVEVYVLTRPSALHGWWKKGNEGKPKGLVEWLMRHHPEVLRGFKQDIKSDAFDAVLLRYVKPKYLRKVTKENIDCWVEMVLLRTARAGYQALLQQIAALPILEEEKRATLEVSEELLQLHARRFVETVKRCYPVDGLFDELGIDGDLMAQAYCCEVFLEIDPERSVYRERNHFGLKWSNDKKIKLLRDGQALHALNQLTAKVMGANPSIVKKGFRKAMWEILKKVHKFKREIMGFGRARQRGRPGHGYSTG